MYLLRAKNGLNEITQLRVERETRGALDFAGADKTGASHYRLHTAKELTDSEKRYLLSNGLEVYASY